MTAFAVESGSLPLHEVANHLINFENGGVSYI